MHSRRRAEILLLCDTHPSHAETLLQHVAAFERFSRHRVTRFNPIGVTDPRALTLERYDVVVLHWSLVVTYDTYLAPSLRAALHSYDGLLVQFIQDEYRWVDAITEMMRYLGVSIIFSVVPPVEFPKLYGERVPGARVEPTLTGFLPDELLELEVTPQRERPLHIGYRGRELPFWLGHLAQEKVQIARDVLSSAARYGLRCDIDWTEESRIYGEGWFRFLGSCRATLATPSGASIVDYDGSAEAAVRSYTALHPDATFVEVQKAVLGPYEDSILIDVVSPRIFEAAALRTVLILFEGGYSGVVDLDRHAIALERDLSNFAEVAALLEVPERLEEIAAAAHADIVASGRYTLRAFMARFDDLVDEGLASLDPGSNRPRWRGAPPPGFGAPTPRFKRGRALASSVARRIGLRPPIKRT